MFMIEGTINNEILWATPMLSITRKNGDVFNRALAKIVLGKEREILSGKPTQVAGIKKGITAHWLEFNVLNWNYPEIDEFRQMVLNGAREFIKLVGDPDDPAYKIQGISCWANILRYGEGLDIHHHDPGFISAHYQVQSGLDRSELHSEALDAGGQTIYFRPGFIDRSQGGEASGFTSPWDSDWRIITEPVEGKLVFFPSYVRHEVRPYLGKTERISVAMDIYVAKQNAPIFFARPRWFVP
jgi:putative 2-oxoglutarate-Fe(II)-dependent oxygenase superfamily protein